MTAEELAALVKTEFDSRRAVDKTLAPLAAAIREGTADYETVNRYAIRLGELLSESLAYHVNARALPDGRFYEEFAQVLLGPLLENDQALIAEAAAATQNALNRKAGLGLKAVRPKASQSRIKGLATKVASYESYDEAAWVLKEPIVTFSQSVVDDAIRLNVEAHAKAGLDPIVQRVAFGSPPCPWCARLAGTYRAPVEREVYRRHGRCRCVVLYDPGGGHVVNRSTKIEYASAERALRDARIAYIRRAEEELSKKRG